MVSRLTNAFDAANVTPGNKAIRIKAEWRAGAPTWVACYQYRRYLRFISLNDQEYVPGVIFPTTSSGTIINYPKRHSDNCTTKHQATKQLVQADGADLQEHASKLVEDGTLAKDTAPSYYIEGMPGMSPKTSSASAMATRSATALTGFAKPTAPS